MSCTRAGMLMSSGRSGCFRENASSCLVSASPRKAARLMLPISRCTIVWLRDDQMLFLPRGV